MTTVCAALFDIFTTFGFPKIVQSDNGTEFVNSAIRQLFDRGKIEHRLVASYHRETNHGYEYLVRWKNYSPEHDSWEPATNFDDEATIIQYWRRRQSLSTRTPSAGRE
jgi:Chromo (CHRromatin Organisation MOdifier) domain